MGSHTIFKGRGLVRWTMVVGDMRSDDRLTIKLPLDLPYKVCTRTRAQTSQSPKNPPYAIPIPIPIPTYTLYLL